MTRSFSAMTESELSDYLPMLKGCVEPILPRDCRFAIVIVGDDGRLSYITGDNSTDWPEHLRAAAHALAGNESGRN